MQCSVRRYYFRGGRSKQRRYSAGGLETIVVATGGNYKTVEALAAQLSPDRRDGALYQIVYLRAAAGDIKALRRWPPRRQNRRFGIAAVAMATSRAATDVWLGDFLSRLEDPEELCLAYLGAAAALLDDKGRVS